VEVQVVEDLQMILLEEVVVELEVLEFQMILVCQHL
tara:strand:+ start:531 stop:638 length:108 start_codon:yes stop_codon:yes gene_type:complete